MLVRGRVQDDLRRVLLEERAHASFVAHVGHERQHFDLGTRAPQLGVHLEERELRPLDEQELRGLKARNLADELRADGAARPRSP